MRAPVFNTVMRMVVAAFAVVIFGAALSACGGAQPTAAVLMRDTFKGGRQIESGVLDVTFSLQASGGSGKTEALQVHLHGPFQSDGTDRLPQFALSLEMRVGGHPLALGATSAQGGFFLDVEGSEFALPKKDAETLQSAYAQAAKQASRSASSFATLGIEPGAWIQKPVNEGEAMIDGEATEHVRASLDAEKLLSDVSRLSEAAGSVGASGLPGALSPKVLDALARSMNGAQVNIYTGRADHLLRRLTITAALSIAPEARQALSGLSKAKLSLDLTLSEVNRHQSITAPSGAKPLSQLLESLSSLGLVEPSGASTSSTSGSGASTSSTSPESSSSASSSGSSTSGSSAYLECVQAAGGSVHELQRCASLLHGS